MALSAEDEEIASQYRKMLSFGSPEGAVIQRMAMGGVPQHIQDDVISPEVAAEEISLKDEGSGRSESHTNRSNNSIWEEEVVEDDESIEEEVLDDDGEFEEEYVEEEYVEESEYFTQKDEYENEKVENEVDSDGPASTGAASDKGELPGSESIAGSNATTTSHSNANDRLISRRDIENQQQVQGYQPQPNATALVKRPPEKGLPSPNSCWYWAICLVLVLLVGAGAGGGYWLTTRDGVDVSILNSSSRTSPPTTAPSVSVSTEFDAVKGVCDFRDALYPNPIDQCLCFGEIVMIETDVRDRYLHNLEYFIPNYFEDYNEDISSCSPKNQALVWISSGDDAQLTETQRSQKFALATIYASLGGSKWKNNTNWLDGQDVCTWHGVLCRQDYVTELVLDENNLNGVLPSELSLLEKLLFLMVARNKISGPIPVSLFSIETLGTVDVGFNSITGVIPPSIENAVSLNSLNVEFNAMSGRLTKNIGKASNLGYLNLKSNQFASDMPMELFNLKQMKHLEIGGNKFIGTIPDEISNLKRLEVLTLGPNLFTGTIPPTISLLEQLRYLSIRGVEGLRGSIPAEFGFHLSKLEEITISETGVSGNIDTSFGSLPALTALDFSKNQLRSLIPSELGNLLNLVSLDLGHNFLYGPIPDTFGGISALQRIQLNDNLLQGGIPIALGNLKSLETIRLEANRLEDRVADEICDLREDGLKIFVVDCPIEIRGDSGIETFGVVCKVPECCTECMLQ